MLLNPSALIRASKVSKTNSLPSRAWVALYVDMRMAMFQCEGSMATAFFSFRTNCTTSGPSGTSNGNRQSSTRHFQPASRTSPISGCCAATKRASRRPSWSQYLRSFCSTGRAPSTTFLKSWFKWLWPRVAKNISSTPSGANFMRGSLPICFALFSKKYFAVIRGHSSAGAKDVLFSLGTLAGHSHAFKVVGMASTQTASCSASSRKNLGSMVTESSSQRSAERPTPPRFSSL